MNEMTCRSVFARLLLMVAVVLLSVQGHAASPVAIDDTFARTGISNGQTLDLTKNDRDLDGDAFWVDAQDITTLNCPINSKSASPDGTIDLALGFFSEACQFTYRLTSLNILGEPEHSNVATVTLLSPDSSSAHSLDWSDSTGSSYSLPVSDYSFGELSRGELAGLEHFTLLNSSSDAGGVTLSIDLDFSTSNALLSLGDHGFGNTELTAELAPRQSVSFDVIAHPSFEGDISGALQLAILGLATGPEQRMIQLSGRVVPGACQQVPFVAQGIPGRIEAESFDVCGYQDATTGNLAPPVRVRPDEDVDVRRFGSRQAITQTSANEWIEYTLAGVEPGSYNIRARYSYASNSATAGQLKFHFGDDTAILDLPIWPNSNQDQFYQKSAQGVFLDNEVNSLRVEVVSGGFNLDYVEFVKIHGEDSAPTAVGDMLVVVGDDTGITIRKSYFLRNDQYDPYLLNPWEFELPELELVSGGGTCASDNSVTCVLESGDVFVALHELSAPGTYEDVFSYKLVQGGFTSNTVGVTVKVDPVAQLLVANDDVADLDIRACPDLGDPNQSGAPPCYSFGQLALTSNDSAANSANGFPRFVAAGIPTCGGLSGCTGRTFSHSIGFIGYTPDPRLLIHGGTDSFTYTVQSPGEVGEQATGTVYVTFYSPPVANDDFADHPLLVALPATQWIALDELLGNDAINFGGTHVVATELNVPSGMEVSHDNSAEALLITFNRPGRYQMGYQLEDDLGQRSNWARVFIDAANAPPIARDSRHGVYTGQTATGPTVLELRAEDSDGDSLSILQTSVDDQYGEISVLPGLVPRLRFTPRAGRPIADLPVAFTVTDGYGTASATAVVNVILTVPEAMDDLVEAASQGSTEIDIGVLLRNDSGLDILIPPDGIDTTGTNGTVKLGGCSTTGIGRPTTLCFSPDGSGLPTSFKYDLIDRFGQRTQSSATVVIQ